MESRAVLDTILVAAHVSAGMAAVVSGAATMCVGKGSDAHRRGGRIYVAALAVVCLSGIGLAITRWPRFPHLFALAVLAAALAATGYAARRRPRPAAHLLGMTTSYVVMLTAFYVDNGPNLPLWRHLPDAAFWVLPAALGAPILIHALLRHPLVRQT
jgi:uncharacterized membrane protein